MCSSMKKKIIVVILSNISYSHKSKIIGIITLLEAVLDKGTLGKQGFSIIQRFILKQEEVSGIGHSG